MKCIVCKHYLPKWEAHNACWQCRDTVYCRPSATCELCADWSIDEWKLCLQGLREIQARRFAGCPTPPSPSDSDSARPRPKASEERKRRLDLQLSNAVCAVSFDLSLSFSFSQVRVPGAARSALGTLTSPQPTGLCGSLLAPSLLAPRSHASLAERPGFQCPSVVSGSAGSVGLTTVPCARDPSGQRVLFPPPGRAPAPGAGFQPHSQGGFRSGPVSPVIRPPAPDFPSVTGPQAVATGAVASRGREPRAMSRPNPWVPGVSMSPRFPEFPFSDSPCVFQIAEDIKDDSPLTALPSGFVASSQGMLSFAQLADQGSSRASEPSGVPVQGSSSTTSEQRLRGELQSFREEMLGQWQQFLARFTPPQPPPPPSSPLPREEPSSDEEPSLQVSQSADQPLPGPSGLTLPRKRKADPDQEADQPESDDPLSWGEKLDFVKRVLPGLWPEEHAPAPVKKVARSMISSEIEHPRPSKDALRFPLSQGVRGSMQERMDETIRSNKSAIGAYPARPSVNDYYTSSELDDKPTALRRHHPHYAFFKEPKAVEIPWAALAELQHTFRVGLATDSAMDWLSMATRRAILQCRDQVLDNPDVDRDDLAEALLSCASLVTSIGKGVGDKVALDSHSLWVSELWRRDAFLSSLKFEVPDQLMTDMRVLHPVIPSSGAPTSLLLPDRSAELREVKKEADEKAAKSSTSNALLSQSKSLERLTQQMVSAFKKPQSAVQQSQPQQQPTRGRGRARGRASGLPFRGASAGSTRGDRGRGRGRGRGEAPKPAGEKKPGTYSFGFRAGSFARVSRRAAWSARFGRYSFLRRARRSSFNSVLERVGAARGLPLGRLDAPSRIRPEIREIATVIARPKGFHSSKRSRTPPCSPRGDNGDDRETSDRTCSRGHSRVLQRVVCGSQSVGGLETSDRSFSVEQVLNRADVFHGNAGASSFSHASRFVGGNDRSQRCLFPYSNETCSSQIPEISLSRPRMAVSGAPVRIIDSAVDFHHGGSGSPDSRPQAGDFYPPVSRRLANPAPLSRNADRPSTVCGKSMLTDGVQNQPKKVRLVTASRLRLLGVSLSDYLRDCFADAGSSVKIIRAVRRLPSSHSTDGQTLAVPSRDASFHGKVSSVGPPAHAAYSAASTLSMVPGHGRQIPARAGLSGSRFPSAMVAGSRQSAPRVVIPPAASIQARIYGCQYGRLGRSLGRQRGLGHLVFVSAGMAHKPVGTGGRVLGSQALGNTFPQSGCVGGHRQLHRCRLHQQAGRYEVPVAVPSRYRPPALVSRPGYFAFREAYPWSYECLGGPPLPEGPGPGHGVESCPQGIPISLRPMGHADGRFVCDPVEPQTSFVCVSHSRSHGHVSGCDVDVLGGHVRVCLPPSGVVGQGDRQVSDSPVSPPADCSVPPAEVVVPGPSGVDSRLPSSASGSVGPPQTTSLQHVSSGSRKSEASCLDIVERCFRKKGFSREVSARIARSNRKSSLAVYQSKWTSFCAWCRRRKVSPFRVDAPLISEFLLEKFNEGRAPSTIAGYRTAIAKTLKPKLGIDFGHDQGLTALINSFEIERPKARNPVPEWDLSLVLNVLRKDPFEPLERASLKFLTFKTVFLLALASGKRRSELHALSFSKVKWKSDGSSVLLGVIPSFLAKTQLAGTPLLSFSIPALTPSLGPGLEEDAKLCPVRALRIYVNRTRELHLGKRLLFVSYLKDFPNDIRPATISSWIKKCVRFCYEKSQAKKSTGFRVKAHDVRALAASLAFTNKVSLNDVMSACTWKSHNTFTSFYLRELAWEDDSGLQLGRLVAAESVVQL